MGGGPKLDWQIFLEASTIYSSFSGHDYRPFDCSAAKQTDWMNMAASSTAVSRDDVTRLVPIGYAWAPLIVRFNFNRAWRGAGVVELAALEML